MIPLFLNVTHYCLLLFPAIEKTPGYLTPTTVTTTPATNKANPNPEHAFDLDLFTSSITVTDEDVTNWFSAKLPGLSSITSIRLYHRFFTDWFSDTTDCVETEKVFTFTCLPKENNTRVTVRRNGNEVGECGVMTLNSDLTQEKQIYDFSCGGVVGDEIYLVKESGLRLIVFEMVITGIGKRIE